ncbi:MAG: hypothetical protein M0R30_02720 [Methanoregula sp.]|uniref:hypothetical protein n=1 Tax=Methanoregula sp. TaxID=2052170 RepID=UPI0025FDD7D9|nr:hypothetical protein [Methanoregula sp.]MCK9630532.1 hypothetical protein [Methanoregula sp.]
MYRFQEPHRDEISRKSRDAMFQSGEPACPCFTLHISKIMILILLCTLLFTSAASATEYVLNSTSIEQYKNGIHYTGEDKLILVIEDDATIQSNSNAGIESAAPVTIRSPANNMLTIIVDNDSAMLYGIKAPSVSVESGLLYITVNGKNKREDTTAVGICAGSGNVTISGGSINTNVNTTAHKNKGISASRSIIVTGGWIVTSQHGGSNTFGLDGGGGGSEKSGGGVIISGGDVAVLSTGGVERNIGIDSRSSTVRISGNSVIIIYEDESGAQQNYPYNTNITTISGGNAVVFTSTGGNFTLRENAVLTQNALLIADRTVEIPVGRTLGISEGTSLKKPAGTTFLFGTGYGTFEYARAIPLKGGAVIFAGKEPAQKTSTQNAHVPVVGLFAGLGAAVLLRRNE